jgi:cupin 2 domain-containing protein
MRPSDKNSPDRAMQLECGSLFNNADPPESGERFESLGQIGTVCLERIVSSAEPEHDEYDQAHDEWVLLVRGTARLEIGDQLFDFAAGDHVRLPAHTRHRVLETSAGAVWLALHDKALAKGVHRVHLVADDGDWLTAYLPLGPDGQLIRAPEPWLVKATFGGEELLGEFKRGDKQWNRIIWSSGAVSFIELGTTPVRRYARVRLYDDGTDPMDAYEYLVHDVKRA